jgi:ketosteroid isomerase-like protein
MQGLVYGRIAVESGFDVVTDEVVQRAKDGYAMFQRHDPAFLDGLDPEIEYRVPDTLPGGGHLRGQWEMLAFMDTVAGLWDDPRPEPEEFLPAGDKLIVLGTWRATAKATGVSVEVPFAHVLQHRDGRLASVRVYMDAAKALRSLEATPSR